MSESTMASHSSGISISTSEDAYWSGWGELGKARDFNAREVEEKLISYCSELRSQPCSLVRSTISGSEHVLRTLQYSDKTKVVARFPLPFYMESARFASDYDCRLRSEVATQLFIR